MYQGSTEYPSLHLTVTDNFRYWKDKLVLDDTEEAILKIAAWLRKHTEGNS